MDGPGYVLASAFRLRHASVEKIMRELWISLRIESFDAGRVDKWSEKRHAKKKNNPQNLIMLCRKLVREKSSVDTDLQPFSKPYFNHRLPRHAESAGFFIQGLNHPDRKVNINPFLLSPRAGCP